MIKSDLFFLQKVNKSLFKAEFLQNSIFMCVFSRDLALRSTFVRRRVPNHGFWHLNDAAPHSLSAAFVYNRLVFGSEKQRYAPDTCKSDYGIDYSADDTSLSSANPRDNVKLEKSYASPVQRADYGQDKCDFVHNHINFLHSAAPAAKVLLLLFCQNGFFPQH